MRKIFVLMFMCISLPVAAENYVYVGGGITGTHIETDGLVEALNQEGLLASGESEDIGIGLQVYAGYRINKHFGFEIKVNASGDAEDTILVFDPNTNITAPVDITLSTNGVTGYAIYFLPLNEKFELSGKLGYTYQEGEVEANVFGISSGTFDDNDNGVGIGAVFRYFFSKEWAFTAEVEYLGVDFDDSIEYPKRYSVNAEYRF